MDLLQNQVLLLTQQAKLVVDYGFIVGLIAVLVACGSMYFKERTAQELRRTGERHDKIQRGYYDPSRKVVVTRPEEIDDKRSGKSPRPQPRHQWRSRS
jgi:hypothetical protein